MRVSVVPRQFLVIAASVLLFLSVCFTFPSQAQDKVELFAGYSYLRGSVQVGQVGPLGPGTPCPPNCGNPATVAQHANLNGWEFSGQYKVWPFVGVVADFDGNYGTLDGGKTHVHTFVFGPQVSLPAKVSPFAHAFFGVAKESQDPTTNPAFSSLGSDTSFATALGAGIDVKAARFLSIRLLQVDYLRTHLHGTTQNQPRVSAGIVLHF